MRALVLTWPKTRPLESYLATLTQARRRGQVINYHVAHPPRGTFGRVYMVHDGAIRGWSTFREIAHCGAGEVSDGAGGHWPPGWYIVREPDWHPVSPVLPMAGFRGYRYLPDPVVH